MCNQNSISQPAGRQRTPTKAAEQNAPSPGNMALTSDGRCSPCANRASASAPPHHFSDDRAMQLTHSHIRMLGLWPWLDSLEPKRNSVFQRCSRAARCVPAQCVLSSIPWPVLAIITSRRRSVPTHSQVRHQELPSMHLDASGQRFRRHSGCNRCRC